MSRIDDLSADNPLRDVWVAIEALRNANPLQAAAVGRGGITVYGGGVITIENGGLSVTGYAEISGELRGDGTIDWTGPVIFRGPVEITETLDVTAETRLRGDTTIEGLAKLLSELQVEGKITAGNVVVEEDKITVGGGSSPAELKDGALGFGTGGKVEADVTNGGVRLIVGTNRVYVGTGAVAMQVGSMSVTVTSSGVTFGNLPTIPKSLTTDANPVNSMFVTTAGEAFRVVAG